MHDNKEVKLRLLAQKRILKFKGWSNYEIVVKLAEGEVYVAIYSKKNTGLRKTRECYDC